VEIRESGEVIDKSLSTIENKCISGMRLNRGGCGSASSDRNGKYHRVAARSSIEMANVWAVKCGGVMRSSSKYKLK